MKLVVLSGSGISAESGIKTFRDTGGLWEEYKIEDVASPEGFEANPKLVLDFYNQRRKQLGEVQPNDAHRILAELEQDFNVQIITQNVDNLHERAGSSKVLHLHGELTKVRSTKHPHLVYNVGYKPVNWGDKCEKGHQLRPHIVWFGEAVPAIEQAILEVQKADIFVVIGTSLNVYPAANLGAYTKTDIPKFLIDPNNVNIPQNQKYTIIQKTAGEGMKELKQILSKLQ